LGFVAFGYLVNINWVVDTWSGAKLCTFYIGLAHKNGKVVKINSQPPEKQTVDYFAMSGKSSER
jgi:hypothetical protein